MARLTDWEARRSGGRITVYGNDPDGKAAKITKVDIIVPRGGQIVAVDSDNREHILETV